LKKPNSIDHKPGNLLFALALMRRAGSHRIIATGRRHLEQHTLHSELDRTRNHSP
jgi:hypothetical protein